MSRRYFVESCIDNIFSSEWAASQYNEREDALLKFLDMLSLLIGTGKFAKLEPSSGIPDTKD